MRNDTRGYRKTSPDEHQMPALERIPPAGTVWADFVNARKPMPYVMRYSHLTIHGLAR